MPVLSKAPPADNIIRHECIGCERTSVSHGRTIFRMAFEFLCWRTVSAAVGSMSERGRVKAAPYPMQPKSGRRDLWWQIALLPVFLLVAIFLVLVWKILEWRHG